MYKEKGNYDKEAWRKKKQTQLENCYRMIDNAFLELSNGNSSFFKTYLNIQSQFDKYSIRNALLVAIQNPNALQLKDYKSWLDYGTTFKKNISDKILILEPGEAYINKSGKKIIPYSAKEMIDISQTNSKINYKTFDKKLILQSLLYECSVDIRAVDELDDNKMCIWDKDNNVLFIRRSDNNDLVISSVAIEISKINLYEEVGQILEDKSEIIGYMICKRYDIKIEDDFIEAKASIFKDKNKEDIVNELSIMKNVFDDINNRINIYLENKIKEKNNEQER